MASGKEQRVQSLPSTHLSPGAPGAPSAGGLQPKPRPCLSGAIRPLPGLCLHGSLATRSLSVERTLAGISSFPLNILSERFQTHSKVGRIYNEHPHTYHLYSPFTWYYTCFFTYVSVYPPVDPSINPCLLLRCISKYIIDTSVLPLNASGCTSLTRIQY